MTLLVKICGLKTPDAVDAALDAGADMVGFVFFPPSPRDIALSAARDLGRRVKDRARKVALTVDADEALLATVVESLRPDVLQLHGRETPDRVRAIKARFGLPVMKAVAVEIRDDLAAALAYGAIADRLLFDARAPLEATRPGGLGKPFDWHLLQGLDLPIPFMLSGGLDPENVADALRISGAPGVDVSSGIERAPGEKDLGKIRAFVRAARRAHTPATLASQI
jgi:phosphoribosylanthranilate isomerase